MSGRGPAGQVAELPRASVSPELEPTAWPCCRNAALPAALKYNPGAIHSTAGTGAMELPPPMPRVPLLGARCPPLPPSMHARCPPDPMGRRGPQHPEVSVPSGVAT